MEQAPRVVVAVPCRNASATILRTLRSLQAQTYEPLRVVVVDNASMDGTVDLVRGNFPDVHVQEHDVDVGAEGNFERCFALAAADELLAIYHADDLYEPDIVAQQVEVLRDHPEVGLVFAQAHRIDEDDRRWGRTPRFRDQLGPGPVAVVDFAAALRGTIEAGSLFVCPSAMGRARVWQEVVRTWDGAGFGTAADVDVWLRASLQCRLAVITEPLMSYRQSPSQGTATYLRGRTGRADVLRVLEHHMAQASSATLLEPEHHASYARALHRDDVVRAANYILQGQAVAARQLLRRSFAGGTWRALRISAMHLALRVLLAVRAWPAVQALARCAAGR